MAVGVSFPEDSIADAERCLQQRLELDTAGDEIAAVLAR